MVTTTDVKDRVRERIEELKAAQSGLLNFTKHTFPTYIAEPAHELMAEAGDRVVSGEIHKLMIFAPPQHGKSELFSRRLLAYWLAKRSDDPVIMASYAAPLAEDNSKQARGIVEDDLYKQLFPDMEVDQSTRSGSLWRLANGRATVRAAGTSGGITGFPGLLGLIDDPHKDRQDANSDVKRKGVIDWWKSSYRTRIWGHGSHALVMTRWHWDDLAGWLIRTQGAVPYEKGKDYQGEKRWVVLRLPALAEGQAERDANNKLLGLPPGLPDPLGRGEGEALCPIRFPRAALLDLRNDVGLSEWSALYQGVPRPNEGRIFRTERIEIIDAPPARLKKVRYWDFAATQDGGAYTCGGLIGEKDGEYYILGIKRGQWGPGIVERNYKQTAKLDGKKVPVWIEQEPGSSGKMAARTFVKMLAGWRVSPDRVTGQKEVRWGPFASQVNIGNVFMVRGQWNEEVIEELDLQPDAPYKDITDSLSGGFSVLAENKKMRKAKIDFYNPPDAVIEQEPFRDDEEVERMLQEFEAEVLDG